MRSSWTGFKSAAAQVRRARKMTDGLSHLDYEILAKIAWQLDQIADRATPRAIAEQTETPKFRIGISGDIEEIVDT